MKTLVALTIVSLLATPAFAGDAPAKPAAATAAPAAPPAPPEVKKTVDAFAGNWTFEGQVSMPGAKEPLKATETFACRSAALGHVVACTGKGKIAGMGPFEDEALIVYDAEAKNVRFVGFDSMGTVHDHTCSWKDDKTLTCQPLAITMGGQPASVDLTATWPDAKNISFNETTTMKDGSKLVFEGKGKRK